MRPSVRPSLIVAPVALLVAALTQLPSVAQETSYAFAAEADSAGLSITLAGTEVIGGAKTHAELDLTGPTASGFGEALTGAAQTRAESSAPPDGDPQTGASTPQTVTVPNLIELTLGAGTSSAESEAEDGLPSALGEAALGTGAVTAGVQNVLGLEVSVSAAATSAAAEAKKRNEVESRSSSQSVLAEVKIDPQVLSQLQDLGQVQQQLCDGLATIPGVGGQLSAECDTLFNQLGQLTEPQSIAKVTLGGGQSTCGWDGETPTADGNGSLVAFEFLGQVIPVPEGTTQTVGAGTPLETSVTSGAFLSDVQPGPDGDSASGRAGGASIRIAGDQVAVAIGDSTCGVTGEVEVLSSESVPDEPPLPRTGGTALPVLGAAVLAAGLGLGALLRRLRKA